MEVEIFEVGANSPAERELTLWLKKQTTGSNSEAFKRNSPAKAIRGTSVVSDLGVEGEFVPKQMPEANTQDQTRTRPIPILSKAWPSLVHSRHVYPYISRLFYSRGRECLKSDGSVVQASAQVAAKPLQFVTPTSEEAPQEVVVVKVTKTERPK